VVSLDDPIHNLIVFMVYFTVFGLMWLFAMIYRE